MTAFEQEYRRSLSLVEELLGRFFRKDTKYKVLLDAMAYSLNAGGKRVRPILTLQFAKACGDESDKAAVLGCGVEMVHTYSLIHDDLPCMDDDDLRRGKPTNHKVYGEAVAVLAGDALQTAAFQTILESGYQADIAAKCALELAKGAGADGMCGGQVLDMEGVAEPMAKLQLMNIHRLKTGALLEAACVIGAIAGGGTEAQINAARSYAADLGMAFQIRDDLLDHISTTEALGKPTGSDEANDKITFYSLMGREGCEEWIRTYTERAKVTVRAAFDQPEFLCDMADWLAGRMN